MSALYFCNLTLGSPCFCGLDVHVGIRCTILDSVSHNKLKVVRTCPLVVVCCYGVGLSGIRAVLHAGYLYMGHLMRNAINKVGPS